MYTLYEKFKTSSPSVYDVIKQELAGNNAIKSYHQVIIEWNHNAYTKISEIGCFNNAGQTDSGCQNIKYSDAHIETDISREKNSPLLSIFEINRPQPGIIKSIYLDSMVSGNKTLAGESSSLFVKNMFNMSSSNPRLYPMGNESSFKYWSSGRTKNGISVGTSDTNWLIDYAAPYIIYSNNIWTNKVSIKTQKHLGYVKSFDIDAYIDNVGWVTIYTEDNTSSLSEGILDIYYDPSTSTWIKYVNNIDSPDEKTVFDFTLNNGSISGAVKIKGLRFRAKKMSQKFIPLEMIELSPRLVADITNYVADFDINSEMQNSSYGLPIGSIVSSNGSITISNTDGAFSKNNSNSIIHNLLKPNVEIKLYQKLIVNNNTYRFPLKTLYTDIWNEGDNSTVNVSLEDYFKFFKERSAPDILIANKSGVPTSVALLMLMDNIGFNSFIFQKTSTGKDGDKEDVVLDFFYSKKEQTVMEVLESLAISTQTSIYMDASNNLVAMTKEKSILKQKIKDFWIYGNDQTIVKDGISYISNISGFQETFEPPITDINIEYNDIGLAKQPVSALVTKDDVNDSIKRALEDPSFSVSLVDSDFRNSGGLLWEATNKKEKTENVLAAAILTQDIPSSGIYAHLNNRSNPNNLTPNPNLVFTSKSNKEALITELADNTDDGIRSRMNIVLDKNYIHTFSKTSYSGYVRIDQEIIKYNGIMFLISNPKYNSYKKQVFFNEQEYNQALSSLAQGGSLEPQSLILDIEVTETLNFSDSSKYDFVITGDGRGENNTEVKAHKGINTHKLFLQENEDWKRNGVMLYNTSLDKAIINNLTVSTKTDTYINNQTMKTTKFLESYTANLKLSGPKCFGAVSSNKKFDTSNVNILPISDPSEQVITGIFKQIKTSNGTKVRVSRLGTRMRLIYDVPKNVQKGSKSINSGVTAGIAWDVYITKNGVTGYFLEVEDVGTINGSQLSSNNLGNMRLYKISKNNGKFNAILLGTSWVNVTNTSWSGLEQRGQADGKSQTTIFDLDILISRSSSSSQFDVYWEGQNVLTARDTKNRTLDVDIASTIGLFVRGQSSAIYEHVYAYSGAEGIVPTDVGTQEITYFSDNKQEFNRCYLPSGVTRQNGTDGKKHYMYFEDFGKLVREVKKFDIRYDNVALNPQLISISRTSRYYQVSDFKTTNHGASFWVHNTGNSAITLDGTSGTPLYVFGFPLVERNPGSIKSSEFLEKQNYETDINDKYNANRKLYGKQELQLSGQFINNRLQAKSLAKWVINNLSKERKTLKVDIFANPLLQLGDKVGLLYSDKYYTNEQTTYTITSISYSVKNNGPEMSITLRECV